MNRIQRISRFFRWIFQLSFMILPLPLVYFWISAPEPKLKIAAKFGYKLSYIPGSLKILSPMAVGTKILGFLVCLIPLTVELFILYHLIQLFKQFELNNIFTRGNVNSIRFIASALLIGQLLQMAHEFLLSMVVTWHNPPGQRLAIISFTQTNLGIVFAALLIILISWIFSEAEKIQEERQYTI